MPASMPSSSGSGPVRCCALADPAATWVYVRFLPTDAEVKRIHEAGKRLFIAGPLVAGQQTKNWTRAAALPLDAILTDYPLELAEQLRANAQ